MHHDPIRPADAWTGGAAYERYVGRWGRLVARAFVPWMGVAPGARWVDVGCGTGAVAATILDLAEPATVLGVDSSEGFLAHARETVGGPHVSFEVGDAAALPADDGSYDAVVAGLVLNFVPDPRAALTEWRRVTRAGGVLGAYVWDYAEGMDLLRRFWDAAVALDGAARSLDEGVRFPIARPQPLTDAFEEAGLADITTRAIDVPTRFADFDDLWRPFLGGQGPAPTYAMSLPAAQRDALRDRLRADLPIGPDGSIDLAARAWAVRGLRG